VGRRATTAEKELTLDDPFRENIFDCTNGGLLEITRSDFSTGPIANVTLHRDDDLKLVLELTSHQFAKTPLVGRVPGDIHQASETIEFRHAAGWKGAFRGVIETRQQTKSSQTEGTRTSYHFRVHTAELDFNRTKTPTHVVEWVSNLPDQPIWTEPQQVEMIETVSKLIGSGSDAVRMHWTGKTSKHALALHVTLNGEHIYLLRPETEKSHCQIVYQRFVDEVFRNKVRTCLSFTLGRPIVYLGHTVYCAEWVPITMRSVTAFSAEGAFFKLLDGPPYPINLPQYANVIDESRVNAIASALLLIFDEIKLSTISWWYWYAACAPVHSTALHFGSLIEMLQKAAPLERQLSTKLIDDRQWQSLKTNVLAVLHPLAISPDEKQILVGKISSLNQAPQSLVLKRLLDSVRLRTSSAEINAWKHRNMAAHGISAENAKEMILNGKLLRLLFHRLLAAVSKCSDHYVDYYSLAHPARPIAEPVPGR
jgi:hypothetical protein